MVYKLRAERDETILEVSRTTQQLAEIELQIEESNRCVLLKYTYLSTYNQVRGRYRYL